MHPGCMAPVILFLVGGQNAGKSHFGRLICRYVLKGVVRNSTNKNSLSQIDTVPLDLSSNPLEFLRNITGNSVVAQIGEMTGFSRGEMTKIKDFVTRTSDPLHYKFEGTVIQPRQWIAIMDGNEYRGVHRDMTGNRRFAPYFVGQTEDQDGQPTWDENFQVDFSNFEHDFFQVMAEARREYDRIGERGYVDFVGEVVKEVREFNYGEMQANRGTARNTAIEAHLSATIETLIHEDKFWMKRKGKQYPAGASVTLSDFDRYFLRQSNEAVNQDQLKTAMSALGAIYVQNIGGNRPGYLFAGKNIQDLSKEFVVNKAEGDEPVDESELGASGEGF